MDDIPRDQLTGALRRGAVKKHVAAIHVSGKLTLLQRKLSNVLLQPHHASGTVETRKARGALMRDNLAAHFAGRPLLTPVA